MHLKRVYSFVFVCNVLYISIKSKRSVVLFKTSVSLLIFHLDDLPINVNMVLKYPTIIVLLSISPFLSVNICFICLGVPVSAVNMLMIISSY